MMRRHLTGLAIGLALTAGAPPALAQDAPMQFRWLGSMTCGAWRAGPRDHELYPKSLMVNWVLGVIAGRSAMRGDDVLRDVEIESIAAWLDDYCAASPLDTLVQATFKLEQDLIIRRQGGAR